VLTKNVAEIWSKAAANTGSAAFWRLVTSSDTGVLSTTEARIQGLCGLAGSDINLATLAFTSGTVYTIDTFSIAIPTL
jgi:hypothetical protein